MAGPTDMPMRNNSMVIPSEVPLKCSGVDTSTMLKAPISTKDSPMAITDNSTAIMNSVEWWIKSKKNPTVLITHPIIVGFMFPILGMRNPEDTDTINVSIINGSCKLAASTEPPPKPIG